MHLNPSWKHKQQTVENHRHMILKKLDEKKFVSNRRLIVINRMKSFIESIKYQRKYINLNLDEQILMTQDIQLMLRRLHKAKID